MFRINNKNIILIWLIIFFACSLPIVKRRRPQDIYSLPQLIPLNSDERMMIDSTFIQSGDRDEIAKYQRRWDKFESHPLLIKVFPKTKFYKLYSAYTDPSTSYIFSFYNGQFNVMPVGFNHLLLDNGLEVTDKNIIELAKAFVVIAFMDNPYIRYWEGEQYIISAVKEITFLEGKRIKEGYRSLHIEFDAEIKCRINDEIQTWKFYQTRNTPRKGEWVKIGQLGIACVFVNNKPIRSFRIKKASIETEK